MKAGEGHISQRCGHLHFIDENVKDHGLIVESKPF